MGVKMTRRDLLRWGIVLGGGAVLPAGRRVSRADDLPSSPPTTKFKVELLPGRGLPPTAKGTLKDGTERFEIHEKTVTHQFNPQPGESVFENVLWGYDGMIPGPTFIATSGTPQRVTFFNDLPENDPVRIGEPISAIHRHGGFQAPENDGHPLDFFHTGQSREYFYPNRPDRGLQQNEHSTNWYHDHSIDVTAVNVYRGLAGFFLYRNTLDTGNELDQPPALGLPSGDFDIGLVIQDRLFDRNGHLVYNSFDHNGFIGDKFCVNGLIQPFLTVKRRKYRFRFLNGSNARVYQLFLSTRQDFVSTGQTFVAIGTDSHLLPAPVKVESFRIAPAERVEVVIDFKQFDSGQKISLVNRLKQTDGRKPDDLVSPGTPILQFVVNGDAADPSRVPDTLLPVTEGPAQLEPQVTVRRRFKFERSHGAWVINGEFFDEHRVDATPKVGDPEIWTLESGGGWVHPVHIHLSEFFILSRDGKKPLPKSLEHGRKDTVLIGGDVGSEVRILIKFEEFTGRYVFHCHNIEHEDMRMMGQFEVQP